MPEKEIILRDHLAIDRTKLANQRTILAYIRTAIMIFASGITIIKLIPADSFFYLLGILLIILIFPCLAIGFFAYCKVKNNINRMYK